MLDDFGQLVSGILTLLEVAIWIIVMIDCLRNSKAKNKVGWVLFIFFAPWIGVVVYLFVIRGAFLKRVFGAILKWVRQQSASTYYYSSPPPQPPSQPSMPHYDYQQGYQGYQGYQEYQGHQTPYQAPSAIITQSSDPPAYEQPQAAYPEMPPMEQ
jgi:hypothetical protein